MDYSENSLGRLQATYKPKMGNIVAGLILGTAFILGGMKFGYMIFERESHKGQVRKMEDRIATYAFAGLLGVLVPVGGFALLVWMKKLISHRVEVFENGFAYVQGDKTENCPWEEVEEIHEIFTHESMKVLKIPGATIKKIDRSFMIKRNDGKEFRFNVNSINHLSELADYFESASKQYDISWMQVEQ